MNEQQIPVDVEQRVYLATSDGLVIGQRDRDEWHIVERSLTGQRLTSVAAGKDAIWVGGREGVHRSEDGGETWRPANEDLAIRYVRWLACPPGDSSSVLAGTEPANIFHLDNGGAWRERPQVAKLRDAHGWYLPYSPEAGCIRGFAFHGDRAYAAAEVGGVLRSDDGGQTWALAQGSDGNPKMFQPPAPLVHPDVHSLVVHPSSADRVVAPTGGGLYGSTDGGTTWAHLYACYCRAAWVDPSDAAHIVFGPADGVSRNGRIEASHDGGQTWRPSSERLETPWPRHMVERFLQVGDALLAVLSSGQLLCAPLATLTWRRILPDAGDIKAAAVMAD
jgi:photosystem II stability/assembly factor-like uncharacterized protein